MYRLQYVSAIRRSCPDEEKIVSLGNPLYKVTDIMEPFPAPDHQSASSEECVFKPSPKDQWATLHVERWQYLQPGLKWWVIYIRRTV